MARRFNNKRGGSIRVVRSKRRWDSGHSEGFF